MAHEHYLTAHNFLVDEFSRLYPAVDKRQHILWLIEFGLEHGEDGIVGMAGFIQYAKNIRLKKESVLETLAHDINGRKDKHMLPRTNSYIAYFKPNEA